MQTRRVVRAGRRSTIGNRVNVKSVSRVRIPCSPPYKNLTVDRKLSSVRFLFYALKAIVSRDFPTFMLCVKSRKSTAWKLRCKIYFRCRQKCNGRIIKRHFAQKYTYRTKVYPTANKEKVRKLDGAFSVTACGLFYFSIFHSTFEPSLNMNTTLSYYRRVRSRILLLLNRYAWRNWELLI